MRATKLAFVHDVFAYFIFVVKKLLVPSNDFCVGCVWFSLLLGT